MDEKVPASPNVYIKKKKRRTRIPLSTSRNHGAFRRADLRSSAIVRATIVAHVRHGRARLHVDVGARVDRIRANACVLQRAQGAVVVVLREGALATGRRSARAGQWVASLAELGAVDGGTGLVGEMDIDNFGMGASAVDDAVQVDAVGLALRNLESGGEGGGDGQHC